MTWQQKWTHNVGNRSMEFSDQKDWVKRTPEAMARLQDLREKQQPWVDWTVDWDNFILRDDISPSCVFQAKKVSLPGEEGLIRAIVVSEERRDAITHIWETYRLKAVLRSGKTLPYDLMKQIGPKSKWKTISAWIEEAGELPGLSEEILRAVMEVQTEGYKDVLADLVAGKVADQKDRGRQMQENRALSLVVDILKSWEALRNAPSRRPNAKILERQDEPDED